MIPKVSDRLLQQYRDGKIKIKEVAKKLGCSIGWAYQRLIVSGYVPHTKEGRCGGSIQEFLIPDKDYQAYRDGELTQKELADRVGCSVHLIRLSLYRRGDDGLERKKIERLKKVRRLFDRYVKEGVSLAVLADEEGVSKQRISQRFAMIPEFSIKGWHPATCQGCGALCSTRRSQKVLCPSCTRNLKAETERNGS